MDYVPACEREDFDTAFYTPVRTRVDYSSGSTAMQANLEFEPRFRRYVLHRLSSVPSIRKRHLINSGAEHVGCSPETGERYMDKLTSDEGPLVEFMTSHGLHVRLRSRQKVAP